MTFTIPQIAAYLLAIIIIYLFGWLLISPLKYLMKTLFWSLLGILALVAVNFLGTFVGISISINLFTCLVASVLGVPGVALILVIQAIL